MSQALINQIADWLMKQALDETEIETVVVGCCERLRAAGIPVMRGYFAFTVLHPLHGALGITWTRGHGTTIQGYPHIPGGGLSKTFERSPHYYMLERKLEHLRMPIDPDKPKLEFPIFTDIRDEGGTDYYAFIVGFGDSAKRGHMNSFGGFGMLGSWTTDNAAGFSDSEIEALLRIQERLAVTCKLAVKQRLMRSLAETYLGRGAGAHVLDGQIRRGDGQSIRAAIWYSDLRDSSKLADELSRQDYIDALNTYFDVTGGAVLNAGGDILSFIGDALLAIFPTDGTKKGARKACNSAARAARQARNRLALANTARADAGQCDLEYGTALHLGEVMYGNVGVPERLTFSVFGRAVNEVARLEELTKVLKVPVLATEAFNQACRNKSRDLGDHSLRGIANDIRVFAPEGLES